jgi:SAM-dependent methyltransferase
MPPSAPGAKLPQGIRSAMTLRDRLPTEFIRKLEQLEESYLTESDPIRQSGFGGGPERWRVEREPILEAVDADGDLLDVGCANGYLLECLVRWGAERGRKITPFGLDHGARLIELAKQRLPEFASNFYVGNAWDWEPPRRFRYVYTLHDCVPEAYLDEYVRRLLTRVVEPGGRLILGAYGSRSQSIPPLDVAKLLASFGHRVVGRARGGDPPVSAFAWTNP